MISYTLYWDHMHIYIYDTPTIRDAVSLRLYVYTQESLYLIVGAPYQHLFISNCTPWYVLSHLRGLPKHLDNHRIACKVFSETSAWILLYL